MSRKQGGKRHTEKEQMPARYQNDTTLFDELNNGTAQRWRPKQEDYNRMKCIMKILQFYGRKPSSNQILRITTT